MTAQNGHRSSHSDPSQRDELVDPLTQAQITGMVRVLGEGRNGCKTVTQGVQRWMLPSPPGELLNTPETHFDTKEVRKLQQSGQEKIRVVENRHEVLARVARITNHLYDRFTSGMEVHRCQLLHLLFSMCENNADAQTALKTNLGSDEAYNDLVATYKSWKEVAGFDATVDPNKYSSTLDIIQDTTTKLEMQCEAGCRLLENEQRANWLEGIKQLISTSEDAPEAKIAQAIPEELRLESAKRRKLAAANDKDLHQTEGRGRGAASKSRGGGRGARGRGKAGRRNGQGRGSFRGNHNGGYGRGGGGQQQHFQQGHQHQQVPQHQQHQQHQQQQHHHHQPPPAPNQQPQPFQGGRGGYAPSMDRGRGRGRGRGGRG